jgi:UPF0716 protein FxsA
VGVFLLVILFIVVPLAELYVIIKVGEWIGALPTIALLLLDSVLGAALLRHQGRAVWRRFNVALAERRVPARETFDGAMVIFGGALLLTPGFITDIFGLILLIPPTRALIRRGGMRVVRRRLALGERVVYWTYGGPRSGGASGQRPYDVDGTAHEVPDEPPPGEGSRRTLPP